MEFPEPVIEIAIEPNTKADQEKMGMALSRLAAEDPSFRVKTDEESRPDHHRRHGRAASRHHRRPHEARVQGRGECRPAAGRLPRDDHADGQRRLHAQEADRRHGPVRARDHALRAAPGRRRASSSRTRSSAATSRANTSRASRRASSARWATASSPASRWSTSRRRCSTASTTRSTPRRSPSRSPGARRSARACRRRGRCCLSRS